MLEQTLTKASRRDVTAYERDLSARVRDEAPEARFDLITTELSATPDDGSITFGFAQLAQGDSRMALIDRAGRELIAARYAQGRDRRART